ncbi:MAG: putative Ig domain-containing protein, partial [Sphingopyxis sp.]|nr:putative Ig domain-containing protein [Sphingopyxis sp.]
MNLAVLRVAMARWMAIAVLVVLGALLPESASAQHTSLACPPQTATVANGGSVEIDITDCDDYNFGYGTGAAPTRNGPSHGQAALRQDFVPPSTAKSILIYTHNGNGATQDTFELEDLDLRWIRFTITITPPSSAIVVTPTSLPTLTAGTPFSQSLSSTGGTAPYTYSLASGAFPPGLTLSGSGVLSGTPTQRGLYTLSVRSQDSTGDFSVKSYSGSVQNPSLSLATPTVTLVSGQAASAQLATNGGVSPYIYATEPPGTPMPFGLSLSTGGLITGTPTGTGTANISLRVTDASTGPGQYFEVETLTINVIAAPTVSIAVAPASVSEDGATNLVYTVTRSAASASPLTVNLTTSGTATAGTDYTGNAASVTIPANATSATVTIDPTADSVVEPDETVILTIAAGAGYVIGAPSSATGTILNDDVPAASITVAPASVLENGPDNLVFTVALNAASASPVTVNYTVGGTATNGADYAPIGTSVLFPAGTTSQTIIVNPNSDGTIEPDETVILTLAAGAGYTVGTPSTATGTILNDDFPSVAVSSVTVAEGNSGTTNAVFTVDLSAPATASGVTFDIATFNGTATAGSDYVAATGGFSFAPGETSKTFPVQIIGDTSPEADETFTVTMSGVTNATLGANPGTGTIVNDDVPLDIQPANLPSGTVGVLYSAILTTDGGVAPYAYSVTAGSVPTGLTFAPDGRLSGTPVAAGNFSFTVTAQDSSGAPGPYSASRAYTVAIAPPAIELDPVTLPNATFGVAYSQTITADGSIAPYSFAVTSGTLPPGLTLAPGGTLAGTPSLSGTWGFTITATDATTAPGPYAGARAYSITVAQVPLVLPPTTLPDGATDVAYSAQISPATGGVAPYSYVVTSGELPYGLVMSPTGAITGTPTTANLFSFVVTATDSDGGVGPQVVQQSYSINIVNTPPVVGPVTANVPYGAGLTLIPLSITGTANSVAVATPPANGSAVVDRMTISYIPNAGFAGSDSFTYIASNNGADSAPATVTISVASPTITVSAGGALTATVGVPYGETFTFNGGTQPFTGYQVTGLPAGVQVGSSGANTVSIIGTPISAGSFTLTVSATDSSTGSGPFGASQTFTLVVAAPTLSMAPGAGALTAAYNTPFTQAFTASGGVGPFTYALTGALPA